MGMKTLLQLGSQKRGRHHGAEKQPNKPPHLPSRFPDDGDRSPEGPDVVESTLEQSNSRWSGWNFTVILGCGGAIAAFLINVIVLGWSHTKPQSTTNNAQLFLGDCSQSKRIDIVAHLAINILGNLLLGASNNAIQILAAPTRRNIDEAHAQQRFVEQNFQHQPHLMIN